MRQSGREITNIPLYEASDDWEVTQTGDRITRTYVAIFANWKASCPALGTQHDANPLCLLTRARARQIRPGLFCRVTLTYEQDSLPSNFVLPETAYSDNGATILTDLRQHPRYTAVSDEDRSTIEKWLNAPIEGQSPALVEPLSAELYAHLLSGFTHFFDGTFEITKTLYSRTKPTPDPTQYGKAIDPGGGYGQSGHWILRTGGTRREGAVWAEDQVYLYSAKELPEGIYS